MAVRPTLTPEQMVVFLCDLTLYAKPKGPLRNRIPSKHGPRAKRLILYWWARGIEARTIKKLEPFIRDMHDQTGVLLKAFEAS